MYKKCNDVLLIWREWKIGKVKQMYENRIFLILEI